jgi:hypothetical protein
MAASHRIAPLAWLIAGEMALASGAVPLEHVQPCDACGECHRDIYGMWRESAHARSMTDPVFLAAFRGLETRDRAAAATCLRCHAPLAALLPDTQLANAVTWEGVTCDVCHGIVWVDVTTPQPQYRLEISRVKRGPIAGAESTGHEVAHSRLHEDSAICAPCHEYANPGGVGVLTTYSEWAASAAARRGDTCQSCHMEVTRADVVDPRIKRDPTARVNLHSTPGGHSQEQLHEALKLTIETARSDGSLELSVRLKNAGAGHAVPTGMPGRRIELSARVHTYAGDTFEERRSYGKQFKDAQDRPIGNVADYFSAGARLHEDTRIRVDEERVESFRFALAPDVAADVAVKLQYVHPVGGAGAGEERITFFSERRFVAPLPSAP